MRWNAKNKYGAKKEVVDGITFHSKKEAKRYRELWLEEKAGTIQDLKLQPRFPLKVAGILICVYVSDFDYERIGESRRTIEDTKGFKTPEYKIKAKLFRALYPDINFVES